jgi:hypothetical protein
MGIIEDINKIQNNAQKRAIAEADIEREQTLNKIKEKRKADIAKANSDLDKHLKKIKSYAEQHPFKKATNLSLGHTCGGAEGEISLEYAEQAIKNLKKEGFKVSLQSKYSKEEYYADGGYWTDPFTSYWAEVSW